MIQGEELSRKGAKRYRVSKGFLCAFAPLREKIIRIDGSSQIKYNERKSTWLLLA